MAQKEESIQYVMLGPIDVIEAKGGYDMNNMQNADNGSVQEPEPIVQADDTNPHTLWKQILGLSISSIIVYFFAGIFMVLTGIFTFIDAWTVGIYKKKDMKSFVNISPMAWGIVMEFLIIVAYPVYLIKRNKLKTKDGSNIFWILTIVFGGISILFGAYQIISRIVPT